MSLASVDDLKTYSDQESRKFVLSQESAYACSNIGATHSESDFSDSTSLYNLLGMYESYHLKTMKIFFFFCSFVPLY